MAFIFYFSAILLSFYNIKSNSNPEIVKVRHGDSAWVYPLNKYLVVQPLEVEGTCKLLIENNSVRVISSNCPLKICIRKGTISKSNQWIACLPHQIFISITGSKNSGNQKNTNIDTVSF